MLAFSNFLPVQFFGFLVVVSIAGCLLAALVLMPPLVVWLDPRFARPKAGIVAESGSRRDRRRVGCRGTSRT